METCPARYDPGYYNWHCSLPVGHDGPHTTEDGSKFTYVTPWPWWRRLLERLRG